MIKKQNKPPKKVEDRTKRINIKSKRRRGFLKKAIELRNMCDLEMLVVIKDNEFSKIHVYNMLQMESETTKKLI